MRSLVSGLLVVGLVLAFGLVAYAQDAQPADPAAQGGVMCDSDLMLNLFVADRFFSFSELQQDLAQQAADPTTVVDLNQFNQGQFAPLFEGFAAMPEAGITFSDEQRANILDILALDEATFQNEFRNRIPQDAAAAPTTDLAPSAVAGEAPECTQARNSLNRFWTALAIEDFSSGMMLGEEEAATGATEGETGETGAATATMFTVTLTGAEEVPGPGDEDGMGTVNIEVRPETNEVCYDITVQNITLPASLAHIHPGAVGVAGDPLVDLLAPDESGSSSGCSQVDPALAADLIANPANYYINVHTSDFPDGAIRGQLGM
jgi:hypothetical protein